MLATRQATLDDLPWLLEQLRAMAPVYPAQQSLFPEEAIAEKILGVWIGAHVVLIAEYRGGARDGDRVGLMIGLRTPHFLNPAIRCLVGVLWWVPPAQRGTRAAAVLLDAFVGTGRACADWISYGFAGDPAPIHATSLTRRGFRPLETSYLLEVS